MDQNFSSAVVIEGRLTMDNGCCSAAPAVELECSYNSCCKMQDVHLFNSDADAGVLCFCHSIDNAESHKIILNLPCLLIQQEVASIIAGSLAQLNLFWQACTSNTWTQMILSNIGLGFKIGRVPK